MQRERELRLQIMLTESELTAVDDFRFKFRLPSRAAAVRELLHRGLSVEGTGQAAGTSRSKDFGVLGIANGSSFETPHDLESNRDRPIFPTGARRRTETE